MGNFSLCMALSSSREGLFLLLILPGKSHGRRSLVGCSPWGRWESDTTEQLPFHFSLSCVGEGNGNPLQCSCLENPRGGGAWWAAIYGVSQSRTRLKWLSSSSSRCKIRWLHSFLLMLHDIVSLSVLCLVTQLCLSLCDPMDCSPSSSSVHRIL